MEIRQLRNLKTIVDTYGANPQIDMTIEECSELIKALLKYRRKFNSSSPMEDELMVLRDAIIDEIAETKIMLAQMEILFGCVEEVEAQIDRKIDSKIDRLEEAEINRRMDMLGNRRGVNESQSV